MKTPTKTALLAILLSGGLAMVTAAMADHGYGHGKGHGMHQGMHHGKAWMMDLSKEQQAQIDELHLDFKKQKLLLKTKLKQTKVELALLITSDSPSKKEINSKIDQVIKLKSEKMRLAASHKVDVRKLLNAGQRLKFDMHVLKKAYRGKRGKCRH